MGKPADAIVHYRFAHKHARDLTSYRGLMECYIGVRRIKEALSISKEALTYMPDSARALTLVGVVVSHMPSGKEQVGLWRFVNLK